MRKIDFFRALPKLPPPLPPIWASCTTIFGRQKQRLAHITEPRVKKIGQGPPPPFRAMPERNRFLLWEVFPNI